MTYGTPPLTDSAARGGPKAAYQGGEGGGGGGHTYALDAIVAATARAAVGPVTVLPSDTGDLGPLCGKGITVAEV